MAKPAAWSWNAAQVVDDGHRTLAQALTALVPFWEGTGTPGDLITGALASATAGGWATSVESAINGPVWRTDAASEYVRFAANTAFQLDGDIDFSFWITLVKTGTAGSRPGYLAGRSSNATGAWTLRLNTGGTALEFVINAGSGDLGTGDHGADLSTGLHTIAFTRTASTNSYQLFVDGVARTAGIQATNPAAGSHDLVIGAMGADFLSSNQLCEYALVPFWKGYALTQADVNLLQAGTSAGATHGFGLLEQAAGGAETVGTIQSAVSLQGVGTKLVDTVGAISSAVAFTGISQGVGEPWSDGTYWSDGTGFAANTEGAGEIAATVTFSGIAGFIGAIASEVAFNGVGASTRETVGTIAATTSFAGRGTTPAGLLTQGPRRVTAQSLRLGL